jgi:hypothetical protein
MKGGLMPEIMLLPVPLPMLPLLWLMTELLLWMLMATARPHQKVGVRLWTLGVAVQKVGHSHCFVLFFLSNEVTKFILSEEQQVNVGIATLCGVTILMKQITRLMPAPSPPAVTCPHFKGKIRYDSTGITCAVLRNFIE